MTWTINDMFSLEWLTHKINIEINTYSRDTNLQLSRYHSLICIRVSYYNRFGEVKCLEMFRCLMELNSHKHFVSWYFVLSSSPSSRIFSVTLYSTYRLINEIYKLCTLTWYQKPKTDLPQKLTNPLVDRWWLPVGSLLVFFLFRYFVWLPVGHS